jgi:hypothetical protein
LFADQRADAEENLALQEGMREWRKEERTKKRNERDEDFALENPQRPRPLMTVDLNTSVTSSRSDVSTHFGPSFPSANFNERLLSNASGLRFETRSQSIRHTQIQPFFHLLYISPKKRNYTLKIRKRSDCGGFQLPKTKIAIFRIFSL